MTEPMDPQEAAILDDLLALQAREAVRDHRLTVCARIVSLVYWIVVYASAAYFALRAIQ